MTRNPNPSVRKNILPGLQVPAGLPVELEKFLQGVKEHLQVLQGILGQPKERAVTLADLERIGLIKTGVKGGRGEIIELLAPESSRRTSTSSAKMSSLADVSTTGLRPNSLLVYNEVTNRWEATDLSQLAVFTDETAGLVPASGGGQDNFLRADGTWAEPPGSGGRDGALVYVNSEVPAGNTIADTDSETAFESTYEFQAESLAQGNVIRVKAAGVLSTDSSVAPTLTLKVYVGTDAVLTQSVTLSTALSDDGWALDAIMVVQVDGASGALEVQGIAHIEDSTFNLENSTAFTIDTTVALKISITAEWSAADEDNTVTLRELLVYLDGGDSTGAIDLSGLTFITADDETADAPDSKQLVAGNNITLDTSTPGQISVSADAPADASELDYDNAASGLDATNVQAAIDEVLDTIPSDADEISYDNSVSGLTATDVQEAIDELAANGGSGGDGYPSQLAYAGIF